MAEIQKIFFYTGTALVDPDAVGCVLHPKKKDFDVQGRCMATCNRDLIPVYQCPDHPGKVTIDSNESCVVKCGQDRKFTRYVCSIHKEIGKSEEGLCEEKCGKKAVERKGFWGCGNTNHFEKQKFKEKPLDHWKCEEECNYQLKPRYACDKHKELEVLYKTKCSTACNHKMDHLAGYQCSEHTQNIVNTKDSKCQVVCHRPSTAPVTALGYRRNVSVFMKYVGKYIENGKDWGFCVNVAHDHTFQPSKNQTITLSAGRRRFRYYTPMGAWSNETNVDDYLKTFKSLDGKFELFVKTASLLKDRTTPDSLGWKDRYELVQGHGPDQGTKKTVDNCSAKCFASDLNALKEWLSEDVKDQNVFAVCDCNSFHNSGFLFGLLALSRHVKSTWQIDKLGLQKTSAKNNQINTVSEHLPEPVLILNFDRHNDFGHDKTLANSDGWGEALLKSFQCGAYLAIGVPGQTSLGKACSGGVSLRMRRPAKQEDQYDHKSASGINLDELINNLEDVNSESSSQQDESSSGESAPPPPSVNVKKPAYKNDYKKFENEENWKAVFGEIEKFLNYHQSDKEKKKSLKYYYITIDRDCMLHNHNQWNDDIAKGEGGASFFNDEEHIHKAIKAIQDSLGEDIVLTGMDVTGLPESQYLPGSIKTLVSIPIKEYLKSVRIKDESCVYSECKKARKPKEGCPNQECNNKHRRHPKCGHKICPYKSCPSANCPEPECKECRTEIMSKLGNEIDFWYKKFDGWISKQEKKEEKV